MYQLIVRRKVAAIWSGINARDPHLVLDGLAASFSHTFLGDHALGGTRTSLPQMRAFFDRIYRLFPGLQFELRAVAVRGWPWNTTVLTWIDITVPLLGETYTNQVAQYVELKWGKVTKVTNVEDTQLLALLLDKLAASGIEEAHAAPIEG
jgi:hypothetical protein